LVSAIVGVGVGDRVIPEPKEETHCVVVVVDETPDGELVTSRPVCFPTLLESQVAIEAGLIGTPGLALESATSGEGPASMLLSFTLGTHFDGVNGTGSSISVVGTACSGGWWNTGAGWANKISSSWNGCYRLRHFDSPNRVGSSADTIGVGSTSNLPPVMNNKTESVSYLSS
jgi:hypothetical protein